MTSCRRRRPAARARPWSPPGVRLVGRRPQRAAVSRRRVDRRLRRHRAAGRRPPRRDAASPITSIIADPRPTRTRTRPTSATSWRVSRADLIVENGGGYDDFIDPDAPLGQLARARCSTPSHVSGQRASRQRAAQRARLVRLPDRGQAGRRAIADALARRDRPTRRRFTRNAAALRRAGCDALEADRGAHPRARTAGRGSRSPSRCRCTCSTRAGWSTARPRPSAAPSRRAPTSRPRCCSQTLELFARHRVALLAYNEQTSGARRPAVLAAARGHRRRRRAGHRDAAGRRAPTCRWMAATSPPSQRRCR